jgi:hypothetical protein
MSSGFNQVILLGRPVAPPEELTRNSNGMHGCAIRDWRINQPFARDVITALCRSIKASPASFPPV